MVMYKIDRRGRELVQKSFSKTDPKEGGGGHENVLYERPELIGTNPCIATPK